MERKNKGRQRIAMTKMEKESNRQVTFSKRRFGVFKKANELSILCGAQVAVIVFSPGNKAFSFGNSSVSAVVDQFLTGNRSSEMENDQNIEAQRNATMMELSQRLNLVENLLEVERLRGKELDQKRIASQGKFWWEEPIDKMNMKQLEKMKTAMEELKKAIKQVGKVKQEQVSSDVNTFMVRLSFLGTGGSVSPFLASRATNDPSSLLTRHGFSGTPFDAVASSSTPPMLPGFYRGSGH